MSYTQDYRVPNYVRCGWCSAIINTAELEVKMEVPTLELGNFHSRPEKCLSDTDYMVPPHANCPNCGLPLKVKDIVRR